MEKKKKRHETINSTCKSYWEYGKKIMLSKNTSKINKKTTHN